MDDIVKGGIIDPESRRALELDTLAAVFPMDRRDRLAQLLTDDDVETLRHLAHERMSENSLRALASDLAYPRRLAVRASPQPRRRKSKRAVTRDVLDTLVATCSSDRFADKRDLAILLLALASGGRRRSEVARLRVEQLYDEPDVPLEPRDPFADIAVHFNSAWAHKDRRRRR